MSVPVKLRPDEDYATYIRRMETMRINYNRMVAGASRSMWGSGPAYLDDPDGGLVRDEDGKIKFVREHPGPMPIDLRAYIVACEYNPDKRTFGKIIPELVKHKHELHPFMRRYLLERLRGKQRSYHDLAESYRAVADQFDGEDQPDSVSRDIAVANRGKR